MNRSWIYRLFLTVGVGCLVALPQQISACPFCSAASQTLSEEISAADAVILARLISGPPAKQPGQTAGAIDGGLVESKFAVVEVLKGKEHLADAKEVEAFHFGEPNKEILFLLFGKAVPDLNWTTPIPLSARAVKYVTKLPTLPAKGPERLVFFQDYFEDKDALMAQDSYDEFARAPYADVQGMKDQMKHDQLTAWVRDVEISPSRRRLYLTMLGVCGTKDDLPMLEEMLKSSDRKARAGLDALVACYLTIKGPSGMELVEDLFLKKQSKAEYADTYGAIMALRFHGQETDVIPRERLVQGLRHMLDRPDLADLVIADLARWEDWGSMDRLITLFKQAEGSSSWVRVPVVNYLMVAGKRDDAIGKRALAAITDLEKIDAAVVKQAKTYAAFGGAFSVKPPAADKAASEKATTDKTPTTQPPVAEKPASKEAAQPKAGGTGATGSSGTSPQPSTPKPAVEKTSTDTKPAAKTAQRNGRRFGRMSNAR